MLVKVSTFRSSLHDTDSFSKRSDEFLKSIENELGVDIQISPLEDYECDLKLIFIESGGSEIVFKNEMSKLHDPFYFLTSGENNSLAATLEIVTYLNCLNKKAEILHGSVKYIASRIKELVN